MSETPRRVVIVGFPDATLLDLASPADVLDAVNHLGIEPGYQVTTASLGGREFRTTCGIVVSARYPLERVAGPVDTLIVAGGHGHRAAAEDVRVTDQIRRIAAMSRRVASVCTGASVLAGAGLLDGRRATTHWIFLDEIARRYPAVSFDPAPLFVRDGNVYTSAGVTSGLDLALSFVEDDHGSAVARQVARGMVTYLQRPGNQAQVSLFLSSRPPDSGPVREASAYVQTHLDGDLRVSVLAGHVGIGARHLARLFAEELDTTPTRYVRSVRTEAAAVLLSDTALPLGTIARRCGFGSGETLRQAFLAAYDTTPSAYRRLHRRRTTPFTASR
ncbi:transcriptional regulator GlxA family with amidase domain [Actinoalloteichus hoggarensis]|uniref:HTH-type transcriptional regulator CdhR n=1 Tax=Actinoalloteichus hoggarensis TaxID=1470176 RepID=A0A221W4T9_9PSEU|nr:GlxA family transcriptional regulator [Actinoalloteichus hoggarensis]ASO20875.1 HTH-type transcriptional regulator CdhR [Actinoalloteichus hoggarensis]MBB5920806.1 transcriptional regulator GlxA family with amidase domain [Actinoalloteichus hoggarensis]